MRDDRELLYLCLCVCVYRSRVNEKVGRIYPRMIGSKCRYERCDMPLLGCMIRQCTVAYIQSQTSKIKEVQKRNKRVKCRNERKRA